MALALSLCIIASRCVDEYDGIMRTTVALPDDLHRQVMSVARDTSRSFSETVTDLIRRALGQGSPGQISRSERTGLSVVHLGKVITTEDVRSLEDDDQ